MISNNSKRFAYIIGNSEYNPKGGLIKLSGPGNDVDLMADTLEQCGFETKRFKDLCYTDFRETVCEFKHRCMEYSCGLFYFAGHGFEYQGKNYLCAIDSSIENIEDTNVNISDLVNEISQDREFISIIILDCCRDIFKQKFRGLTKMADIIPDFKNKGGTFVAYATTSGESALEENNHGRYTKALCQHLTEKNQHIEQVFKCVRKDVINQESTYDGKVQIPWEYTSLVSDFFFIKDDIFLNDEELAEKVISEQCSFTQIKQAVSTYCEDKQLNGQFNNILLKVLQKIDIILEAQT